MSGTELCVLLRELRFEGADKLDPDSFDWPFHYNDVRPVLDWVCSSLGTSNVLSPAEISHYEQLMEEGKLLDGEDLDFACASVSAFTIQRDRQEEVLGSEEGLTDIRDATLAYKAEALELEKQLSLLQSQFAMLSGHGSALIQGRKSQLAATSTFNGELTIADDSLSARNLHMNAVHGRIASTAKELADYHSGDDGGVYLAYGDFHSYLSEDSCCAKELNQWFHKQLNTGPFQLVAEEGKSQRPCLSLDGMPNFLDVEKSYGQRASKLQQHHSVFATSERQWVEAQLVNAKQQAILMALKSQVMLNDTHIHLDLHALRRKHSELIGELSNLYHKEEKLLYETVPDLCWELAQFQDTYILEGNYDLKVMRQECYLSRQKEFISHLINQLARHQFLKIACQLEQKTMLGAYSLLKVIESELQAYLSVTKSRTGHCSALIRSTIEEHEQGAVDDRDKFLQGVRDLLSIHSNVQAGLSTYVSVPGIVHLVSSLPSDLLGLQPSIENSLPEDRKRCSNELCTLIQSLQQLFFASSTTAQPILTPAALLDEMKRMDDELSAAVDELNLEICKTKEMLKLHSEERNVFANFFSHPDRLKKQVDKLIAKLSAC